MMIATTAKSPAEFFKQVCHLKHAEDLFGPLGEAQAERLEALEAAFRGLVKAYHPDQFASAPGEAYYANEITRIVISLRRQARQRIQQGLYGQAAAAAPPAYSGVIRTARREVFVSRLWIEGAHANIYRGSIAGPPGALEPFQEVVIKVLANPAENARMESERAVYAALAHFSLPEYLDAFCTPERQQAIILGYIPGGYDLIELRRRYQQQTGRPGLPQEHMVWILDRFLAVLGLLHNQHILHGDIQPDNLVVQPATHNAYLLDFLHSLIAPGADQRIEPLQHEFCAPEVRGRRFPAHPVSDIYALGKSMLYLMGGAVPARIAGLDPQLARFLQKMVHPDPLRRAADAWELAEELSDLRRQCFGAAHQFIPLETGGSNGRR